jgi:hypothetical protein
MIKAETVLNFKLALLTFAEGTPLFRDIMVEKIFENIQRCL